MLNSLATGPLLGLLAGLWLGDNLGAEAGITAGVALWVIVWWVTEPVPVPVTSMLPLALFPLTGVLDGKQVALAYGSPLILLMLGGFILSRGMESTGTHRRLAVAMINLCSRVAGRSSDRALVAGFMLAAAALSMWISNTAVTLMLLPIALATLEKNEHPGLPMVLMLGIAYAANIGGMGTPIGTPPNLVFMEIYAEYTGERMGFVRWMSWGIPVVIVFVPLACWWLTRLVDSAQPLDLPEVGRWRTAEKRVLCVFAATALLWITRSEPFGGWSGLFNLPNANDASIALLAAITLFIVPNGEGGRLLHWEQAREIPWGILLLFAGGICIAKAFVSSGLSETLGELFSHATQWPLLLMLFALALGVSFLTETTSNTATTTLLMPILAAAAIGASLRPELLMVPAALSASCAFMLPVATAPNAVVFGSGKIEARQMMRYGVVLNLIGACVITLACYLILA